MVRRKPTAQASQQSGVGKPNGGPLNNIVSSAKKVGSFGSSVVGASKSLRGTKGK
jgi:hypothetical protein